MLSERLLILVCIINLPQSLMLPQDSKDLTADSKDMNAASDDTEIVVSGNDIDTTDQDFIKAIQNNLTPPEDINVINTAKFLAALKQKKNRRTQRHNIVYPSNYQARGFLRKKEIHSKINHEDVPNNLNAIHAKDDNNNHFSGQNTINVAPNEQQAKARKETKSGWQIIASRKDNVDPRNPLKILQSHFRHLRPGDVVLLFQVLLWNGGKQTLNVMTTHNCCFSLPKLEQQGEDEENAPTRTEEINCQAMSLVGQREYTLMANETRNVTLIFASTQLLIYQYQRKGYCEIEFLSEGKLGSILASTVIYFDTALERSSQNDEQTKTEQTKEYISSSHLEAKDGLYTGRLCEDKRCIPVDCIQEFGGEANRFSIYRGKCMPTPYCEPNGTTFYDIQWNRCKKLTDLRLDPVTDLDDVPEIVKTSTAPLSAGLHKLLPAYDLRTLTHVKCDQLKQVSERTWGKTFLCQNLPLVCEKCSL